MLPAWHADYVPPRTDNEWVYKASRQTKVSTTRLCLVDLLSTDALPRAAYDASTIENITFPATDVGTLDVARVRAELDKVCPQGPWLSTMVQYRHLLCKSYDLAIKLAALGDQHLCGGEYSKVDMSLLVGRLLPVIITPPHTMGDVMMKTFAPIAPGEATTIDHHFAGKLCVLSTKADLEDRGDQGEIRALCVTVTPRAFNHASADDPKRITFGAELHPSFGETLCYLLVLHAYPGDGVPYAALNLGQEYESLFQWKAWESRQREVAEALGHRPPRIGHARLCLTKQCGKDPLRAMVGSKVHRMDIRGVRQRLEQLRADGELDEWLRDNAMSKAAMAEEGVEGGLELRYMLLVELLLQGTPAAGLLHGTGVSIDDDIPAAVTTLPTADDLRAAATTCLRGCWTWIPK